MINYSKTIIIIIIMIIIMCIGYTMGNLPKEKAGIVSKEHICEGQAKKNY